MQGLTVVGCGLDSGEILVAVACAALADATLFTTLALGPDAQADAALAESVGGAPVHVLSAAASPAVAAGHAGTTIDPAALIEMARGAEGRLVAAVPGGLMAPLTEHYSNRDFARELGLPLVIAARAAPGVVGQVRLAGEAARATGLQVAAVALTGWPDPPSRVQLDEAELLSKIARAAVRTLPASARTRDGLRDAVQRWPVGEWMESAAPGEATAEAAPAAAGEPLVLDPYDAWKPRQAGDPRNTPRPQIMQLMLEIIAAEGPMTATRAYSLYNRAAGGRKLTSVAKAPLSSAVYWLAREGKLTLTREADIPWQGDDMVRLPDQPAVRVREIGPRQLDEIPLDEIAELVKLIRANGGPGDETGVKRAILGTYGLVRLTSRADEYLGLAIDLAS